MRRIYDPNNGSDVTSSVQAILQQGRSLVTCYLYRFQFVIPWNNNPYGNHGNFCFTDSGFGPVFVSKCQIDGHLTAKQIGPEFNGNVEALGLTFAPDVIRHEKLSYGIGFNDNQVNILWALSDKVGAYGVSVCTSPTATTTTFPDAAQSPANLTVKKCFSLGLFQECPFWIHQAVYSDHPSRGGSFLGTTLMFRGYIRTAVPTRSMMKIALSSLMDVFQSIPVPTQVLTPNNRALPYVPAASSIYGSDFSFVSVLSEQAVRFNTAESVPVNALQDSYMTFTPSGLPAFTNGAPSAPAFRIQGNTAGPGNITVYFYRPPIIPSALAAINVFSQLGTSGGIQGFKNLPPPEFSA